ncbi:hypothetical protein [Sagittula salina]|uniref:Uncharacterized protein n=1 Tax=Sagittula salina TaxID=2820268 RepID=A0A940S1W1_9RHOB|nr:hypothetical protein [Sagittula salina]MBP0483482.1 hypothetical protein [Sagittula salina]
MTWNLAGAWPSVKPVDGDRQGVAGSVRLALTPLRVLATLIQAMMACVNISNDAMMVVGKDLDGIHATPGNITPDYKDGRKIWKYGNEAFSIGPVIKDLNAKISGYEDDPVDVFILTL